MTFTFDDVLYYQFKISIGFWCRQGLNPRSFIQPLKPLRVELTRIYYRPYKLICH